MSYSRLNQFFGFFIVGTLTIPNVFKVNEIEVPVKTTLNALENPDFELTERDEPNPKKIITLVDQVFPQVIGNVLAHQTDKAYELVQPIKTVLKKAGII